MAATAEKRVRPELLLEMPDAQISSGQGHEVALEVGPDTIAPPTLVEEAVEEAGAASI
jgi:hypothetical protein